jgi:hypothetical protein
VGGADTESQEEKTAGGTKGDGKKKKKKVEKTLLSFDEADGEA